MIEIVSGNGPAESVLLQSAHAIHSDDARQRSRTARCESDERPKQNGLISDVLKSAQACISVHQRG
jgi:hypothetical protein